MLAGVLARLPSISTWYLQMRPALPHLRVRVVYDEMLRCCSATQPPVPRFSPAAPLKVGPGGVLFDEQAPTDSSMMPPVETVLVYNNLPCGVLKGGPLRRAFINFHATDPLM